MLMSDKIIVITFHMAPKEGFPIMSDAWSILRTFENASENGRLTS